jgi:hypothetical protein
MDETAGRELGLRRELLRLVLHDTLKKTGVPPQWIGGEATPLQDAQGRLSMEVRLVVEVDEPRFLYYLAAFQADFEERLLEIDARAWDWVARIGWSLRAQREDMDDEYIMPDGEYWQHVQADREVVAAQQGRKHWEKEALARHFEHTEPDHEPEFAPTIPPDRMTENIRSRK